MEPIVPDGEFHHFQLVNSEGEVPLSISVFVHVNATMAKALAQTEKQPITTDDVLALHDALVEFDGDFITAFSNK